MNRRSFLTGLVAAPAIIRPGILMPITVQPIFNRWPIWPVGEILPALDRHNGMIFYKIWNGLEWHPLNSHEGAEVVAIRLRLA